MANPGELDEVARYRYVSFTTYRRTGEPVSTPVWLARDGELVSFISDDGTGKIKRLAHDPRVSLRPCSMRGEVAPGAPTHTGTATVHRDAATIARVRAAIGRKYPEGRVGNAVLGLLARVGVGGRPRAAVVVTIGPWPAGTTG